MNRNTYIKIIIFIVITISAFPSLAQEKAKEPERLVTETKPIAAKIKVGQSEVSEVLGEAMYTIEALNSDDSMVGTFVYKIPEDTRRKLANLKGKSLSDIPAKVEQKDVFAYLEKKAECPELRVEFVTLGNKLKIEFDGIEIYFDRFVLTLPDTPQKVSKLMCRYAFELFFGRGHVGRFRHPINDLLNLEK